MLCSKSTFAFQRQNEKTLFCFNRICVEPSLDCSPHTSFRYHRSCVVVDVALNMHDFLAGNYFVTGKDFD